MVFHPDKCTKLSISQKKNTINHDYILRNHTLESVSSAKYLGVTLQTNTLTILHQMGTNLKRNLKVANTEIKSRAYQALVCPKLETAALFVTPIQKTSNKN